MWPTLLARLHSAGHRSGRKYNTGTYETIISGQIELGRLPVREELQHRHTCSQPCRPDHTWQVADQGWAATQVHMWSTLPARPHSKVCLHVVQAHLFECNLHPRYYTLLQLCPERNGHKLRDCHQLQELLTVRFFATDSLFHLMKNMTHYTLILESLPSVADNVVCGLLVVWAVSGLQITPDWLAVEKNQGSTLKSWTWLASFQGHSQLQDKTGSGLGMRLEPDSYDYTAFLIWNFAGLWNSTAHKIWWCVVLWRSFTLLHSAYKHLWKLTTS